MCFTDSDSSVAFDFYYKWVPTGSFEIGNENWPHESVIDTSPELRADQGYYNHAASATTLNNGTAAITRTTASLKGSGSAGALPWGSAAADYLWNCLVPTQSGFAATSQASFGGFRQNKSTYSLTNMLMVAKIM